MKKGIILAIATVLVVTSLVSGVFAAYQTQIDDINGIFVAKNFVLTKSEIQTFEGIVSIAPGETVKSAFNISNFNDVSVTETKMEITITIRLDTEIDPLILNATEFVATENEALETTLIKETKEDNIVQLVVICEAGVKVTIGLRVDIIWEDTDNDILYIGKTASYNVSAVAKQIID